MCAQQAGLVSAIVLAGGQSTRMGQDKALLKKDSAYGRLTMLAHTQQLLRCAGIDDIHVSRNQVPYIHDNFANRGPLAGIEAALPYCQHDHVIVVPIDMPNLTVTAITTLIQSPAGCAYFAPSALPCKLPVNRVLMHHLFAWLSGEGEKCSLQRLLNTLNSTVLPAAEAIQFVNTNTPEEWSRNEQSY